MRALPPRWGDTRGGDGERARLDAPLGDMAARYLCGERRLRRSRFLKFDLN